MRTTLTIEDHIAEAVERFQKKNNLSFKESINHLLRAGLQMVEKKAEQTPYNGPVFENELNPGLDSNRMNQLVCELESEEFVS